MMLSSLSVFTSSSLPFLTPLLASTGGAEGESYAKILAAAITLVTIVIFVFAQVFGEIAARFSLPAVLGELIAGLA
ncbi:hypothetical protein [Leptothoe spongobia]|uniref:Uncharacterized protein n=1 Tax=Leptothoe spongobia TAU-MAC 1115 TaxID=1967444 RepID=A0A947DHT0_9CYAN|nr:hypothetical protein [Leptothoe spongobia]MBT9317422.1 hypothetical protein [Leptothoe spongobia TAU-MAC 1115]